MLVMGLDLVNHGDAVRGVGGEVGRVRVEGREMVVLGRVLGC